MNQARLYFLLSLILSLFVMTAIAYLIGMAQGRRNLESAVATAQADAFLARLVATETPTPTATDTRTPTVTSTFTVTPTPTPSPTPSATPASPEEWAQRYLSLALAGLNSIADLNFGPQRAEALLRRLAQEQMLMLAPVSYAPLSTSPWATLVIPRTPAGESLPMIFWQEPNDQNRLRGQLLLDLFEARESRKYTTLRTGVQQSALASDPQGRLHVLLVARPDGAEELPVYLLGQTTPATDFALVWRSMDDPLWSIMAEGSVVQLDWSGGAFLPDLVIDGQLPPDGSLRALINAPAVFVEQAPFLRQWANSRWRLTQVESASGFWRYQLESAGLRSTPLTTLAQLIALLQAGESEEAMAYVTRLDLAQQAFAAGLSRPGVWLAAQIDENGRTVFGSQIANQLRFFDNADRTRTFDAAFDLGRDGFYRLAALRQVEPFATDLVTPAPPLPTITPTTQTGATTAATVVEVPTQEGRPPTAPTRSVSDLLPTPTPAQRPGLAPTATATLTPSPSATPTFTPSPTETATATPTDTPTETATATPLPIPAIPLEQPPFARGVTYVFEPARLRGGPGTNYPVIIPVDNDLEVGLFGVTEAGDWYLIRIEEPGHPNFGLLGWMFRDLVYVADGLSLVPRYRSDGTALTPVAPTFTPTIGPPTATFTPEASATPTPLQTPQVSLPRVLAAAVSNAPLPEGDEIILTLSDNPSPVDPLSPLSALAGDGQTLLLRVDQADIQVWGGALGQSSVLWIPAFAGLLWPGSTIYVSGTENLSTTQREIIARRVRIVGAPQQERVRLHETPHLARAITFGDAVALVGGDEGVFLLTASGDVTLLWPDAAGAAWASGDDRAGMILPLRAGIGLPSGFTWMRTDGAGFTIWAQPFFDVYGAAADAFGGVWWIEAPQVGLDIWQLWHWDPTVNEIVLRFQGDGAFLNSSDGAARNALLPRLIAVQPLHAGDVSNVDLYVDTFDAVTQQEGQGFYVLSLQTKAAGQGSQFAAPPRLLLAPGRYGGPLRMSSDQRQLAYLFYDAGRASLTAGRITPPNSVGVLSLAGADANARRTVYQSEDRFEFLAPLLEWKDDNTLVAARSRFAVTDTTGLDIFGVVEIPASDTATGERVRTATSLLLAGSQHLLSLSACHSEPTTLLALADERETLEYSVWDGVQLPKPVYFVPPTLTRIHICWQTPG